MKTPHYFCKSCQIEIPTTLTEIHENTEYHKTRLDKYIKQGIITFDIRRNIEEILWKKSCVTGNKFP